MRTTITLDADVAALVADAMHRDRASMKQVVNEALRSALAGHAVHEERYVLPVHHTGFMPGFDPEHGNGLADQLEDEAILVQMARDGHDRP